MWNTLTQFCFFWQKKQQNKQTWRRDVMWLQWSLFVCFMSYAYLHVPEVYVCLACCPWHGCASWMIYVYRAASNKRRVGGCAQSKPGVFAPPNRSSFPYPCKNGVQTNVWKQYVCNQKITKWRWCEAHSHVVMCKRTFFEIPSTAVWKRPLWSQTCRNCNVFSDVVLSWCLFGLSLFDVLVWVIGSVYVCVYLMSHVLNIHMCMYIYARSERTRLCRRVTSSYKVAFSLLIAVYSFWWKRALWAPSKYQKETVVQLRSVLPLKKK